MELIRIALIEDQELTRLSLSALINTIEGFQLITTAADGESFLSYLANQSILPQVAIMDINMPGLTGIELCVLLQQSYPDIKLIALSLYSQERLIAKMINNGARGYLTKDCELDELMKAVRAVHNFGFYMNPRTMKAIQQVNNYRNKSVRKLEEITVELTNREIEILILICKEYSSQEMADKLSISVRTIEGHRNSLLLKTGCRNTAGLVLYAIRYNVFEVL